MLLWLKGVSHHFPFLWCLCRSGTFIVLHSPKWKMMAFGFVWPNITSSLFSHICITAARWDVKPLIVGIKRVFRGVELPFNEYLQYLMIYNLIIIWNKHLVQYFHKQTMLSWKWLSAGYLAVEYGLDFLGFLYTQRETSVKYKVKTKKF